MLLGVAQAVPEGVHSLLQPRALVLRLRRGAWARVTLARGWRLRVKARSAACARQTWSFALALACARAIPSFADWASLCPACTGRVVVV
jgi:hypothetical protein